MGQRNQDDQQLDGRRLSELLTIPGPGFDLGPECNIRKDPVRRKASAMGVSIRDVAGDAGVSIGTVSKYMNMPNRVAPDTQLRIASAIDRLGYVRNEAARQLRAGESRLITFIAMELNNPFFGDVANAMERRAAASGLYLHIASGNRDVHREARYIEMLAQQRVYGVLLSSGLTRESELDLLAKRRVPTVLVDAYKPDPRFSSVSIDDIEGGRLAAEHLIEQGCRRIAFVGNDPRVRQIDARARGAAAATSLHPEVALETVTTTERSVMAGIAAANTLLARPLAERPDGIFAANDLLAIGLLRSLRDAGIDVPNDIALVGYDDIEFAAASSVPLSSVHRPREPFGRTAIDMLIHRAESTNQPEVSDVVITPELVPRMSSLRRP